jgi:hypothetical protein
MDANAESDLVKRRTAKTLRLYPRLVEGFVITKTGWKSRPLASPGLENSLDEAIF